MVLPVSRCISRIYRRWRSWRTVQIPDTSGACSPHREAGGLRFAATQPPLLARQAPFEFA